MVGRRNLSAIAGSFRWSSEHPVDGQRAGRASQPPAGRRRVIPGPVGSRSRSSCADAGVAGAHRSEAQSRHAIGAGPHPHRGRRGVARRTRASTPELFGLRLDRWWSDLHDGLAAVYRPDQAAELERRLVRAGGGGVPRPGPGSGPAGHAAHARPGVVPGRIHARLRRLRRAVRRRPGRRSAGKIGYLEELGVSYLHLMPLLQPREGDSDGGYAVADYRRVRGDLGTDGRSAQAGRGPARATASAW